MARLVVIEANEVPLRVLREVVARGKAPNIERLLSEGKVGETVVSVDADDRYLYPSQTWATLAMGMDYDDHGVYWYGDPKPSAYPLYWQAAASAGKSVGLVGTLHSSPFEASVANDNVSFAIPDCFADDSRTKPERYSKAQAANIKLTQDNGRKSSIVGSLKSASGLSSLVGAGLSAKTVARLSMLVGSIAAKQVPPERLRLAQDLVFSDVFVHLAKKEDPDLCTYFTNHVAAMMHRYWYAMFPQDWDRKIYPDQWRDRYQNEISAAVAQLDRTVGELMVWAEETDRSLLLVSSMGQRANQNVDTAKTAAPVLRKADQFAAALGLPDRSEAVRAMIPTQSWRLADGHEAAKAGKRLVADEFLGGWIEVDVVEDLLSVTYRLDADASLVGSGSFAKPMAEAGFLVEGIDDHTCGVHDPVGTFALWNAPGAVVPSSMNLLEVAPGILNALGVEPLDHHRKPSWSL